MYADSGIRPVRGYKEHFGTPLFGNDVQSSLYPSVVLETRRIQVASLRGGSLARGRLSARFRGFVKPTTALSATPPIGRSEEAPLTGEDTSPPNTARATTQPRPVVVWPLEPSVRRDTKGTRRISAPMALKTQEMSE